MQTQHSRENTYKAIELHLTNAMNSTELSRSETQLRLADRKMEELEVQLLTDSRVTEEQIYEAVAFKRGALWQQARNRVQNLSNHESNVTVAA